MKIRVSYIFVILLAMFALCSCSQELISTQASSIATASSSFADASTYAVATSIAVYPAPNNNTPTGMTSPIESTGGEVQSGAVCGGDGYIFFTMEDQTISYSNDYDRVSYIFSSRPDGSERKKIFQGCIIYDLAYVNGWLYFVSDEKNEENQGILRIKPDGSGKQTVLPGELISMKIYNNKIYTLAYNDQFTGTYCIDLNGLGQKLLFKHQDDNQYETTVDTLTGVNGSYLFYDAERWSEEEDTDAPDCFQIKINITTGKETPLFDNSENAETTFANRYYYYIDFEGIEKYDFITNSTQTLVKLDWHRNLSNEPFDFVVSNDIVWYTTTMFDDKASTLFGFEMSTGKTTDYGSVPRTMFGGGDLFATKEGLYYACFFNFGDLEFHGSTSHLFRIEPTNGQVRLTQVY